MVDAKLEVILLAEDEEDHARLIMRALKKEGRMTNYIEWVENGRDAVDYIMSAGKYAGAKQGVPALILLDINMPLLNGFEVLEKIKQEDKYRAIPVVMLTTSANGEDIAKALKAGANDYIVKPVQWKDFEEKVRMIGKYWTMVSNASGAM